MASRRTSEKPAQSQTSSGISSSPERKRSTAKGFAHLAVDLMIDRAIEVIGNRDEAMRWLGTPVPGLDYATPISLLGTSEGARRVEDVLGQIEHGVW
jgi:putative toxin-antitoxin system antitoxin component (TIGR02293 family)